MCLLFIYGTIGSSYLPYNIFNHAAYKVALLGSMLYDNITQLPQKKGGGGGGGTFTTHMLCFLSWSSRELIIRDLRKMPS